MLIYLRNRVENLVTNNGEKYTYNHSKYNDRQGN